MDKRKPEDDLKDYHSDQDEDNHQGPIKASKDVLSKRKILRARGKKRSVSSGVSNPFAGVSASGFNGPTNKSFGFGSINSDSKPTSGVNNDENELIKALNEKFIAKLVASNSANSVADFSAAALKYIDFYKQIKSGKFAQMAESNSQAAPKFNFGASTPATTSFGGFSTPASGTPSSSSASSTGATTGTSNTFSKPAPTTSAFSFKPAANSSKSAAEATPAKEESSSSESDQEIKIEGPTFSLAKKPTVKNSPFTFGAKPQKPKDDSDSESEVEITGPTFTFNKKIEDKVFKVKSDDSKPAFTFGNVNKDDANKESSEPATNSPAFTFGAKPSSNSGASDSSSTTPFSFGGASKAVTPAFSFGKSNQAFDEPTKETSAANSTGKPTFSFGQKNDSNSNEKPIFSFGQKNDSNSNEKPIFSFGKSESKPAFNFGGAKNDDTPANTSEATSSDSKSNKPAFALSSNNSNKEASTPFSFKPADSKQENSGDKSTESKQESTEKSTQSSTFTFGSKPVDKPVFSFGSSTSTDKPAFSFNSQSKPLFGGSSNAFTFGIKTNNETKIEDTSSVANESQEKGKEQEEEEEESNANFKPIAQMGDKLESISTGEENEDALYTKRAKLMLFDPSNKESPYSNKGLGDLKILKNKETSKSRILMRAEGSARILLNTLVKADLKYDTLGNGSMVRVPTINTDGKIETYVLRVKTAADGAELLKTLEEAKK